ncbi:hypothetical protein T4B_5535 [Trichinella pseudospiralis]|uniref:Uncharacterized protein n=1 Tax=Trichinella pseudospiralis TaxID=6337 RepID=A0A0V1GAF4_TRIPS|nr:hypothetical protein T4B_5535 [Trichinella pseudospiralis]
MAFYKGLSEKIVSEIYTYILSFCFAICYILR